MTADGMLPLGRFPASSSEIETAFVVGKHPVRREIWDEWQRLNLALAHAVNGVAAAWLGGSFFTDKVEPGDLDCVYVIDWAIASAAKLDRRRAQFLEVVARSAVKSHFGLRVDSFVLEWFPTPGSLRAGYKAQYLEDRGYWDDLWSRQRSSDPREDSIPRRGYLEVVFDGYT